MPMNLCKCGCGKSVLHNYVHGHNPNQWVTLGLAARFWPKVSKHGPIVSRRLGRCWLWTGVLHPKGYGQIGVNGVSVMAHRAAWLLGTGKWPNPQALHKCDNRACVRLSHLFEGTNDDNVRDRIRKGRTAHKLTLKQVQSIRKAQGLQSSIAKTFGVHQSEVSRIKNDKRWRHL